MTSGLVIYIYSTGNKKIWLVDSQSHKFLRHGHDLQVPFLFPSFPVIEVAVTVLLGSAPIIKLAGIPEGVSGLQISVYIQV